MAQGTIRSVLNISLPAQFMRQLGAKIKRLIIDDASVGIGQDNNILRGPYSPDYARYKRNNMRRLTKGEGKTFTDKSGYFFGKTYFKNKKAGYSKSKGYGTGNRLKEYEGQSIISNEVGFVNMTVTGQLFKGLHVAEAKENEVTMSYLPKDAGKLIGNAQRGRIVTGLSDENQDVIRDEIVKYYDGLIDKWAKEDIVIQIG